MRIFFTCVVLCLLIAGASISAFAQQFMGVSATYEHLPLKTFKASASFPFVFAEGKTIFINTVEYGYSVYDYDDWGFSQGSAGDTEQFHEVSYNLLFMQQLSQSWQMLVMPAVGLASDFEGDVSSDDATLIGKVIFIYTFSETFSLGPGVAYSLRDQPVFPVPFLIFEWAIGPKVTAEGIIPDNVTVLYRLHPAVELGVFVKSNSVNYHGDPDKYAVDNPWLAYSDLSVGPTAQLHFSKWVHLNLEGGYAFLRSFKFSDGLNKESSIDLDAKGYLKVSLQVGM